MRQRGARRFWRSVGPVAATSLAAVVPWAAAHKEAGGAPRPAAAALASLPLSVRGPVAAALGGADQAYFVRQLRAFNPGQGLAATFTSSGVEVAAGRGKLGLSLVAYGRPGALMPVTPARPRAEENRVTYLLGGLREWYANGPLGLEQGFTLAHRPAGTGPLTLSLRLSGDMKPATSGKALVFSGAGAQLGYGDIVASDATGRTMPSSIRLSGGRLILRVDDRGARYPLYVDPLIGPGRPGETGGGAGGLYGWAVAMSGGTVVVGAPNFTAGKNSSQGAAYVFTKPVTGWAGGLRVTRLTASDGAAGDHFGYSVAVLGRTVVVGAPNHTVAGPPTGPRGQAASGHTTAPAEHQGAVYLFTMPPGRWPADRTQTAELRANNGATDDYLGWSVAISAQTVVAAAPNHAVGANIAQGLVYTFTMPARGWPRFVGNQTGQLAASDGAPYDRFGYDIAASGQTVVVGAPNHNVGAHTREGAVYVFVKPRGPWPKRQSQSAELRIDDGTTSDALGVSVAVSGATVVAGAPYHTVGVNVQEGAAYVFVRPAAGWHGVVPDQTAELTAGDGAARDLMGRSVAIAGQMVVVGAPLHAGPYADEGAAYVFLMPAAGWRAATGIPDAELKATNGLPRAILGQSVAVSGTTIFAGAPEQTEGKPAREGEAQVFGPPWPTISISAPADHARYAEGQKVPAAYHCAARPGGPADVSCSGPVKNGAPVNTQVLGPHSFTVTATNKSGVTTLKTYDYTVLPVVHIAITSPVPNATYAQGQVVPASYTCTGALTCRGTVPRGNPINTANLGVHKFTVTATDSTGQRHVRTVSYTVVASGA